MEMHQAGDETWRLAGVELAGRMVCAPIAGYSDSPYRRIARAHGAAMVFTELVSAEGIVRGGKKTARLYEFRPDERPIGIQIFGGNPSVMGEAAARLEAADPDVIDINMGCCMLKVTNTGSGANILRDPSRAHAIAAEVVRRAGRPVSAKIRIGWDFETINYREIVPALEEAGVAFITVHGRTRNQKYSGLADWDAIAEIASLARVPVIGNGDIVTHSGALERLHASGCAAVMIGRGAIGNPWIFSGRVPGLSETVALIRRHLDYMTEWYGDYGLVLARKHVAKYLHGFHGASMARSRLMRAESRPEVDAILDALHGE